MMTTTTETTTPTMTATSFQHICQLVHRRAGIFLEPGKEYLVDARVLPIAKEEGCSSIDELVHRLQQAKGVGALSDRVVEALTTNETSFFRDVHPFQALKTHVLPELIRARAATTKTLRIWCAAASTGQEPYTIAMIIREHFPELASPSSSWKLRILATDINRAVLARAREGVYRQLEVNRGLPALMLVKHFEKAGLDWRIKDSIRQMVTFDELNLLDRFPPALRDEQDIIFMRNVLIYFDAPTKKQILGRVRQSMHKDGVLFLGSAETTNNIDDELVPARSDKTVMFKRKL